MGSKDHSFDIVSEINFQEVDNAIVQVKKEIAQRFDFKDSDATVDFDKTEKTLTLKAENEYRLKTVADMVQLRCAKRGISLKALQFQTMETGRVGGSVLQVVKLQNGIPADKAKEIVKAIKESKLKVQAQIQSEQVRVQSQKIDDLQTVISFVKGKDFGIDLQFLNYR